MSGNDADVEQITSAQPALVVGQILGHYQIIAPLGKGGMGEVYLASDSRLDRKVALKLLPTAFTGDQVRLRRFIQEAKATSSLNHPNIITIHEVGEAEGAHFIAAEFIEGQTLRQRMKLGQMSLTDILDVSIQAANALQAAHGAGIVHRDIKPENIMSRPDGYVKVLDFGLAKLTEKTRGSDADRIDSQSDTLVNAHTEPGSLLGTVQYMSPEQARGQVLDHRTDVFSLGAVMYEMAAGRAPFACATSADTLVSILEKEPPPLDLNAPEFPSEFQRIVSKALRKDREERYQTIKDLLIDLKSLKEDLSFDQKLQRSMPSRASVDSPEPTEGRQSRLLRIMLIAAIVAALAIGGAMLWRGRRSTPAASITARPAERTVRYWITVQKYRDGKAFQDPFRLRDDINFEKDYRIRLNITSAQGGRLYLLNEGPAARDETPTFNVLFPSPTANDGSALLTENREIRIPEQSWLKFDDEQGTEKIWVIWSEKDVPEMEAIKAFANPKDRGLIGSAKLNKSINDFLKSHSTSTPAVQRDQETKETVVKANGEMLIYAIMLEHH